MLESFPLQTADEILAIFNSEDTGIFDKADFQLGQLSYRHEIALVEIHRLREIISQHED